MTMDAGVADGGGNEEDAASADTGNNVDARSEDDAGLMPDAEVIDPTTLSVRGGVCSARSSVDGTNVGGVWLLVVAFSAVLRRQGRRRCFRAQPSR